jgi:putative flippase GtrA
LNTPPQRPQGLRHFAGFAASGIMAMITDGIVLKLLLATTTLSPIAARVFAIAVAIIVAWLAHRRLTFGIRARPTLTEFITYLGVAWTAAAVNYAVFAAIMLTWPATEPLLALVAAVAVSTCITYAGLRFGVFRKS